MRTTTKVDGVGCHPFIPTDSGRMQITGSEALMWSYSEDAQFVHEGKFFFL